MALGLRIQLRSNLGRYEWSTDQLEAGGPPSPVLGALAPVLTVYAGQEQVTQLRLAGAEPVPFMEDHGGWVVGLALLAVLGLAVYGAVQLAR